MDSWSLTITAMPMMPYMIWTEETCKEDVSEWNLHVTHVTDVEVEAEVASVAEAAMMIADPEAILQVPEPITDWLSKIYLPVHLGRI
jgi:hypothetical protein